MTAPSDPAEARATLVADLGLTLWPPVPRGKGIREFLKYAIFTGRPAVRYRIIGAGILVAVLILVALQGNLWGYANTPLQFTVEGAARPKTVRLPLLLDAEGVAFLIAGCFTPAMCARQIELILYFSIANHRNAFWRLIPIDPQIINDTTQKANKSFSRVKPWWMSLIFAVVAAAISVAVYGFIIADGPLAAWNPTRLSRSQWVSAVYDGWWANFAHYPLTAVSLMLVSTYFLYFLFKQLWMGFVFARYATEASRSYGAGASGRKHGASFAVVPNLVYNEDGYWGLSTLRRFMQWTYLSTIIHFIASLGMFLLWLPVSQLTVITAILFGILSATTVIYPSARAAASCARAKREFARQVASKGQFAHRFAIPSEGSQKKIEAVWATSNLPFRARSAIAATAIYFLVPLTLLFFSSVVLPHSR